MPVTDPLTAADLAWLRAWAPDTSAGDIALRAAAEVEALRAELAAEREAMKTQLQVTVTARQAVADLVLERDTARSLARSADTCPCWACEERRAAAPPTYRAARYEVRTAAEMTLGQRCAPFRYDPDSARDGELLVALHTEVAAPDFDPDKYGWMPWDGDATHAIVQVIAE